MLYARGVAEAGALPHSMVLTWSGRCERRRLGNACDVASVQHFAAIAAAQMLWEVARGQADDLRQVLYHN